MPTHSTEDTIIGSPRKASLDLFGNETESKETSTGFLERCRTLFRTLGERMTSFDLSRQIYG